MKGPPRENLYTVATNPPVKMLFIIRPTLRRTMAIQNYVQEVHLSMDIIDMVRPHKINVISVYARATLGRGGLGSSLKAFLPQENSVLWNRFSDWGSKVAEWQNIH